MSAVVDGRWGRLLGRLRLTRDGWVDPRAAVFWSVSLTWVPLLILSFVDRVALGHGLEVPFLKDFLPYGQFLLAVPALVIAEVTIGNRLSLAARELLRSGVLASGDDSALERLLDRAAWRWHGRIDHLVILVLTLAATAASVIEVREWLTGDWQYTDDGATLAGWWYLLISWPVLRFLALRWMWRLLVWARVLWRTARMRLVPHASHPDRAGGLAFLGGTQAVFGWLVFAFGVQLSCLIADQVYFEGADLMAFRADVVAFVAIVVIGLFLPLLAFVPQMARARYETLLFLSGKGYDGAGLVERILHSPPDDALPGGEISGLADYGTLFENARLMKPVPLEWRHVGAVVFAAVLPFVPLIFLVMPAREVLRALTQLLI